VDAGISGKRADNRPALQHALDRVCEVRGILVVYSLSRLARSVQDTLAIAERLQASGADLVSLSEQINTTSAAGKMVFRLLAVLAEFERDLISERTKGAMRHKASKGESLGKVPFGKALGIDGRTLVDNPAELEALAMVSRLAGQGMTLRRLAAELDATGLKPRRGKKWDHTTVRLMLKRDNRGDAA
jgi:DNA invertase Pin-like site-specific DNA recombinase